MLGRVRSCKAFCCQRWQEKAFQAEVARSQPKKHSPQTKPCSGQLAVHGGRRQTASHQSLSELFAAPTVCHLVVVPLPLIVNCLNFVSLG
ncbi:hypothetical protein ElyMa_004177500 [Elysia marginata]|uniref:Uncharacterized protein n=1 Tax=Elysia marginata TaxID=1093978 RepID=A0AAV4GJ67_9GAST|nr:hypothetical protein ElyMa_004177500 [Elysia marginata]